MIIGTFNIAPLVKEIKIFKKKNTVVGLGVLKEWVWGIKHWSREGISVTVKELRGVHSDVLQLKTSSRHRGIRKELQSHDISCATDHVDT